MYFAIYFNFLILLQTNNNVTSTIILQHNINSKPLPIDTLQSQIMSFVIIKIISNNNYKFNVQ